MAQEKAQEKAEKPWEYTLRKYLLLMATVVATLTYAAAFNPPGGVWQETDAGHLAGDPIIGDMHYRRYLVFFNCNATAFASSLVVIALILLLSVLHEKSEVAIWQRTLLPLRVVMVLDLLSLLGAYAAGTCRDAVTTVYSSLLVCAVVAYLMVQTVLRALAADSNVPSDSEALGKQPRKVLMLLAIFAVSVTYASGLSTPGGFWDGSQSGRTAGDAILLDHHRAHLLTFFLSNTTAFAASLVIILLLLRANVGVRSLELKGCIVVALAGLVAAYVAGSCRDAETTAYVLVLVALVLGYMLFQLCFAECMKAIQECFLCQCLGGIFAAVSRSLKAIVTILRRCFGLDTASGASEEKERMDDARSLVLLLGTLATTVTYQAGFDPPGGVWQDSSDGHLAGDPILQATNPKRYKTFFYCNSTAFMASLVAIVLVQKKSALKNGTLKTAMILDLFGLIGAYAAGSSREVSTSIYVVALAGGVVLYVVIHGFVFKLCHKEEVATSSGEQHDDDDVVTKARKRQLLLAIVAATITYQAGLTPPGGFWLEDGELGRRAGDPVLFSNYPRRYKAFFYSNSLSFMSAIVHIVLLGNPPKLYRPAIQSYALSVCTAVGLLGLIAAYAAGCTQHLKMSIYVFFLASMVIMFVAVLLIVVRRNGEQKRPMTSEGAVPLPADDFEAAGGAGGQGSSSATSGDGKKNTIAGPAGNDGEAGKTKKHAKRKYLMLLGILMASVTYQAGLEPPGGVWQTDGDGHTAGDPVLRTNRRFQYLFFFHCNSTSFVASIVVVILLIPERLNKNGWWLALTNTSIVLNLLGLMGAHAAGSSRGWETSGWYFVALIITAVAYVVVHRLMRCRQSRTTSHA